MDIETLFRHSCSGMGEGILQETQEVSWKTPFFRAESVSSGEDCLLFVLLSNRIDAVDTLSVIGASMSVFFVLLGVVLLNLQHKSYGLKACAVSAAALLVAPVLFFFGFYTVGEALAGESGALLFASLACCVAGTLALTTDRCS